MTSRIQHRRTSTPNSPPVGLLPGELSVEMADPLRLWVGVPSGLDTNLRRLLVEGGPGSMASIAYVDGKNAAQDAVISTKADITYVDNQNTAQNVTIATKASTTYVDAQDAMKVAKAGDTMSGPLTVPAPPVNPGHAAAKSYVDSQIAAVAQFPEAPSDGFTYGRKNAAWSKALADAPSDANAYGRKAGAWVDVAEEAPSDGLGYMRKNGVWTPSSGGATTDDLPPPGPLQDGQFWWKSDVGTLYLWYDDGNSQQWVQAAAPAAPFQSANFVVKTARRANLVVNGALNVSQENGNTEGTVDGYYAADQFKLSFTAATAGFGLASVANANVSGSAYRLQFRVTTAKAALAVGDHIEVITKLEGYNVQDLGWNSPSTSKDAVLAFGFKGPAGTYAIAIRNWNGSATTHSFIATFTITAGQANTDTYQVIKIPAPPGTMTTWASFNSSGVEVWFSFAAGTTWNAPATGWNSGNYINVVGVSNGVAAIQSFQIWDIYFGADPDKTGLAPVFEVPDYNTELLKCSRYWQQVQTAFFCGNVTSGLNYYAACSYIAPVRTTPTFSGVSVTNNTFPAAVGTLTHIGSGVAENRVSSGTSNAALFRSNIIVNARM
jgi:hypothetical protein